MLLLLRGLAASGVAVTAFFMASVLPSATWPLIDATWCHIRASEEILTAWVIPRSVQADPDVLAVIWVRDE